MTSTRKPAATVPDDTPSHWHGMGKSACCGSEAQVGERLRTLRRQNGLSIRGLAGKCGISVNTLSLIENNRTSPSIHTLNLLAAGLGIPLVSLFEEQKHGQELVYQQAGRRAGVRFPHGTVEKLGEGLPPLGAEPIVVTLEHDQENAVTHSGREFLYCLEGEATCWIAGRDFPLAPGDSLLFDAGAPHRWIHSGLSPCRLLVLFCPMEAEDKPAEHHLER